MSMSRPWKLAAMARQARPHSETSVCRTSRTRERLQKPSWRSLLTNRLSTRADGEQGFEQPLEQASLLGDDSGAERHSRKQRLTAAEGEHPGPGQFGGEKVDGNRASVRPCARNRHGRDFRNSRRDGAEP